MAKTAHVIRCRFFVGSDHFRQLTLDGDGLHVYHLYPRLCHWAGGVVSDAVNPRSHTDELLKSKLAKSIEETLTKSPTDFVLANRGSTILAKQVNLDPKTGFVEILLDQNDESQGLADGATTDSVIGYVQRIAAPERQFAELTENEIPDYLRNSRVHLEVIVGLTDRNRIGHLVAGRNTSRQVRSWSLADFSGEFDWLRRLLERDGSTFQGRIAYDENADGAASVLDVLAVLNLFHREYDERGADGMAQAPVISYASKGRMDGRLGDAAVARGFKLLLPVAEDILKLYDYIHAKFGDALAKAYTAPGPVAKKFRIAARTERRPFKMPFTGQGSSAVVPRGIMYPLVAGFRALLVTGRDKEVSWSRSPFKFWDQHGPELVESVLEQVESHGRNPQTAGKQKGVYLAMYAQVKALAGGKGE